VTKRVSIEKIDNGYVVIQQPGNSMAEVRRLGTGFDELVEILRDYLDRPTMRELLNKADEPTTGTGGL
jgi:hypothetical protein